MTTVMIVDDDPDLCRFLARDLAAQGHQVIAAASFGEAITALATAPPIDVLISDLRMPDHDGLDLLRELRERSPATRSILMSAFASARDYEDAVALGAVAILTKPFSRLQLRTAVERAAQCRTGFHGSVHGLSLVDVLQMLHLARRSVAVTIGGDATGAILLDQGEIVHATAGDATGEAALGQLLHANAGHVRTLPLPEDVPRTITRRFDAVVLDALRVADEASRDDDHDPFVDGFLDDALDVIAPPPPAIAPVPPAPPLPDDTPPPAIAALIAAWRRERNLFDEPGLRVVAVEPSRGRAWPLLGDPGDLVAAATGIVDKLGAIATDGGAIELAGPGVGLSIAWSRSADVIVTLLEPMHGPSASTWFRARSSAIARLIATAHPAT